MAIVVAMPRQGQSVESCIITEWFKNKGDKIAIGDILFAYETDKASFEEESSVEGILLETFYEEGDEVPVLSNVCVIGKEGEDINTFYPNNEAILAEKQGKQDLREKVNELENATKFKLEVTSSTKRIRISPLAKNMAKKLGIEVRSLKGTGPGGRIIAQDVKETIKPDEKTLKDSPSKLAIQKRCLNQIENEFEIKSVPNIRKRIASAMFHSLQNSAQLTHHLSADARQILKVHKEFKKKYEERMMVQKITINDLVCLAVIRTLKRFPIVNTHYLGDKIKWFKKIHLGLAVDTDRGLMVPSLQNADDFSITGLSYQLHLLAEQARNGNIDPDLLSPEAASFTVSNLGNYGVEIFTPIVNLPQTAILGINTIFPRPKDLGGGVYGFVPCLGLSLSYNHQSIDGGEATKFLKQVATEIEQLSFIL